MHDGNNDSFNSENESINSCKLGDTLQKYNYTSIHFTNFNKIIIDDICKKLKMKLNHTNRMSIFRKGQKMFNISYNRSDITGITEPIAQNEGSNNVDTLQLKEEINVNINCDSIDDVLNGIDSLIEDKINYASTIIKSKGDVPTIISFTETTIITPEKALSDVTEGKFTHSTPNNIKINNNGSTNDRIAVKLNSTNDRPDESNCVTPIKKNKNKYSKVSTPLKNILSKKTPSKIRGTLPLNTRNSYDESNDDDINSYSELISLPKFNKIDVYEGKFVVSKEQWSLIGYVSDDGLIKLNTINYPSIFRKLVRNVNNTCVVASKNVNFGKHHCIVYMYCKFPGCKTFKFRCVPEENNTIIHVYSSSWDYYQDTDYGLTSYVKGVQRNLYREQLLETKAFIFQSENKKNASKRQMLDSGNMQSCY